METTTRSRRARVLGMFTAAASALLLVGGGVSLAAPAVADTMPSNPSNPATPPTVGATALPTTQMDGVAWDQWVVGNNVYVAGKFNNARPAGSPAGSNNTTRSNFLVYDITNGLLNAGINIPLNAQALAVAATPDGSRVYIGGDFTTAGGGNYYRIVAFSTATGQIISSFRPIMESEVRALAVTNTAVYAGGTFSSVNGTPTGYIAKLDPTSGALITSWKASADYVVDALAVSPDGTIVYAGGRFQHVNGEPHYGLVMLDGTTGATRPFPANNVVRDAGLYAGITSLAATSDRIYGSGYVYGSGGNLEGSFSADAVTGALVWLEDCHGDSYSVQPLGSALYVAGHPHDCSNVGGFPDTNPRTFHHTLAFSQARTGTLTNNGNTAYANFAGQPAPTLQTWFPNWTIGTFTGMYEAVWSLSGDSRYLVAGGEFTAVNGQAQYGLTRFAFDAVQRSTTGPNNNTALTPTATSTTSGQAKVSWTSTYDQDNYALTYALSRDGDTAHPVYTTVKGDNFWNTGPMGFTDTGLVPGSAHTYTLTVTDPDGNSIARVGNKVVVAGGGTNQPPVAAFTYGTNGLTVSVDGSASSDPDGTIAGYAWTFGDGGTASTATATHQYAAAGSYTVTLKVTDNQGATNSLSKTVSVATNTGNVLAQDTFARTVTGGWGSAPTGGAWSVAGTASAYTVGSGTGNMIDPAGSTKTAALNSVSSSRADTTVTFTTDIAATSGGAFVSAIGRQVGSADYEARVWISSTGAVQVQLLQSGNALQVASVSGLAYTPGMQLDLRVQVVGTSPTTLQAKVWAAAGTEPASWQVSLTDSTAALQTAGGVGLRAYLSGTATVSPITVKFADYQVVAVP
ncbi:PKD domain-containing protein [Leifsonia sp. L25]|uniref:PKD domain-containing protein n=1 Tax=Actinomycetes TaxID=1760 RepID=UPI003D69553A